MYLYRKGDGRKNEQTGKGKREHLLCELFLYVSFLLHLGSPQRGVKIRVSAFT